MCINGVKYEDQMAIKFRKSFLSKCFPFVGLFRIVFPFSNQKLI